MGVGSPDALSYCWRCGRWVQARAQIVGSGNAIAGALVAVGIGVAVVAGLKLLGDLLADLFD